MLVTQYIVLNIHYADKGIKQLYHPFFSFLFITWWFIL